MKKLPKEYTPKEIITNKELFKQRYETQYAIYYRYGKSFAYKNNINIIHKIDKDLETLLEYNPNPEFFDDDNLDVFILELKTNETNKYLYAWIWSENKWKIMPKNIFISSEYFEKWLN